MVRLPILDDVRIASPCGEQWAEMEGDDRKRFCARCERHVFNLTSLTRDEAEAFLRENAGECIRLYRRADGTVLTADCPAGVAMARLQERFPRIALVIGAAVVALSSLWLRSAPRPPAPTAVALTAPPAPAPVDSPSFLRALLLYDPYSPVPPPPRPLVYARRPAVMGRVIRAGEY